MRMWKLLVVSLLVIGTVAVPVKEAKELEYDGTVMLDAKLKLEWLKLAGTMTFVVTATDVTGWVGIGVSPSGGMEGSDLAIMWMDQDGKCHISDRHGPARGNGFPPADDEQNWTLLSCEKKGKNTEFTVTRQVVACGDKTHDLDIVNGTNRVLWAYSNTQPQSSGDFAKHDNKGAKSLFLLQKKTGPTMDEVQNQSDVRKLSLPVKDVRIPSDSDTLYWCQVYEVPEDMKNQQLVAYSMDIQSGSEQLVHHWVVYSCTEDMSKYLGKPEPCFNKEQTQFSEIMTKCESRIVAAWAEGGEPFVYPSNMGHPVFDDGAKYISISAHYTNFDLKPGLTDSSSFSLYLSPKKRDIEVDGLVISQGPNPVNVVIPPKQKKFTTYAFCSVDCTKMWGESSIFVTNGLLHAHLTAVGMKVRHIDAYGTEQAPLFNDEHYDYNYQNIITLNEAREVKRGDLLILECNYNTMEKENATFGGLATNQEMCIAFMEYYPKMGDMPLICSTDTEVDDIFLRTFGAENITYSGTGLDAMIQDSTDHEWYPIEQWVNTQIDWSTKNAQGMNMVERLQQTMLKGKMREDCINGTLSGYKRFNYEEGVPKVLTVYEEPDQCSGASGVISSLLLLLASVWAVMHF